jgi:hypothetical protein
MKRLFLAAIAVIAIGAVVPAALAAPSPKPMPATVAPSSPKATGDVDWSYAPSATTGHVTFNAQATPTDAKGDLVYTDSTGSQLRGAVTWYKQLDSKSALFGGPITSGRPAYLAPANPYFVAKVVDNGTPGTAGPDKIAVWANVGPQSSPTDDPIGSDLASVTGGNLIVH